VSLLRSSSLTFCKFSSLIYERPVMNCKTTCLNNFLKLILIHSFNNNKRSLNFETPFPLNISIVAGHSFRYMEPFIAMSNVVFKLVVSVIHAFQVQDKDSHVCQVHQFLLQASSIPQKDGRGRSGRQCASLYIRLLCNYLGLRPNQC
jgi:hypothetical protein